MPLILAYLAIDLGWSGHFCQFWLARIPLICGLLLQWATEGGSFSGQTINFCEKSFCMAISRRYLSYEPDPITILILRSGLMKYTCILALIRFLTPTEYFRRWKVLHWSEFSGKSWLEWLRGSRMWSASPLSSHWLSSCGWRRWTLKWKLMSVWLINKSIIGNLRDWEVVEADLYWEDVQ